MNSKNTRRGIRTPAADRLHAKAKRLAELIDVLDELANDPDLSSYKGDIQNAADSLFSPASALALEVMRNKPAIRAIA